MAELAINTFNKGIVSDKNPLTSKPDELTDALNATYITYNGNEMVLLNDMGNVKLQAPYPDNGAVRLTLFLELNSTKIYDTDINSETVDYNLYNTNIFPFKPIGVVEHGGILYIASQREVVNSDGTTSTEFELGSFPGPSFTDENEAKYERTLQNQTYPNDDSPTTLIDLNNNIYNLDIVYPLYILGSIQDLELLRPGTPCTIYIKCDGKNKLSTDKARYYFTASLLNLSDGNKDITKTLKDITIYQSLLTDSDSLLSTYFPNIKNTLLGIVFHLENIDDFDLGLITGTESEETDYQNRRLPFLVAPYMSISIKDKYLLTTKLKKDTKNFYLSFLQFYLELPSEIKADSFTIRYTLLSKDTNTYVYPDDVTSSLIDKEGYIIVSGTINNSNIVNKLVLKIGDNKRYIIDFYIYPESQYFNIKYNDNIKYHFLEHIIHKTIDLSLNPGLWDLTCDFFIPDNETDAGVVEKFVWGDKLANDNYEIICNGLENGSLENYFSSKRGGEESYIAKVVNYSYSELLVWSNVTQHLYNYIGSWAGPEENLFGDTYDQTVSSPYRIINKKESQTNYTYSSTFSMLVNYSKLYNLFLINNLINAYSIKSEKLQVKGLGKCRARGNTDFGLSDDKYGWSPSFKNKSGFNVVKAGLGMRYRICTPSLTTIFDDTSLHNNPPTDHSVLWQQYDDKAYNDKTNSLFTNKRLGVGNGDESRGNDSYDSMDFTLDKSFSAKDNSEWRVEIGPYCPFYAVYMWDKKESGLKIYSEVGKAVLNQSYTLYPTLGTYDPYDNLHSRGIFKADVYVEEPKYKLSVKNETNQWIYPLVFLRGVKNGVTYKLSNKYNKHVNNTKSIYLLPTNNKEVFSENINGYDITQDDYLKNLRYDDAFPYGYDLEHRSINNAKSTLLPSMFAINTAPYNIFTLNNNNVFINYTVQSLNSEYELLLFYIKGSGKIYIAAEDTNGTVLLYNGNDYIGYNLGNLLKSEVHKYNRIDKSFNSIIVDGTLSNAFRYIQIPIKVLKNSNFTVYIDSLHFNIFRNFNISPKMDQSINYEIKGAVITFKEDLLFANNFSHKTYTDSNLVQYGGTYKYQYVYLPVPYYEIYEGNFTYEVDGITKSNNGDGTFTSYTTLTTGENTYNIITQ